MADPWQEKYRKERAKRIARIVGNPRVYSDPAHPPLVKGGQGRSAESIHRDTAGVAWCLACIVLLIVLLIVGGGS